MKESIKESYPNRLQWHATIDHNRKPKEGYDRARRKSYNENFDWIDQHTSVIHGHFLPVEFQHIPQKLNRQVQFSVGFRDPAQRLKSHYNHWAQTEESNPMTDKIQNEGMRFEEFVQHPYMRNRYADLLQGFPLRKFDFIGIKEDYNRDFRRFSDQFFDGLLQQRQENVRDYVGRKYSIRLKTRRLIKENHKLDYAIYEWARENKTTI